MKKTLERLGTVARNSLKAKIEGDALIIMRA